MSNETPVGGQAVNQMDEIREFAEQTPCHNTDAHKQCTRQDRDRLLAAVEGVNALHYQQEDEEEVLAWQCVDGPCEHGDDACPEVMIKPCAECSTPEYYIEWPCPTVKAITAALEGKS